MIGRARWAHWEAGPSDRRLTRTEGLKGLWCARGTEPRSDGTRTTNYPDNHYFEHGTNFVTNIEDTSRVVEKYVIIMSVSYFGVDGRRLLTN